MSKGNTCVTELYARNTFHILWAWISTAISASLWGITVCCCQPNEEFYRPNFAHKSSFELQWGRHHITVLSVSLVSTEQSFGGTCSWKDKLDIYWPPWPICKSLFSCLHFLMWMEPRPQEHHGKALLCCLWEAPAYLLIAQTRKPPSSQPYSQSTCIPWISSEMWPVLPHLPAIAHSCMECLLQH